MVESIQNLEIKPVVVTPETIEEVINSEEATMWQWVPDISIQLENAGKYWMNPDADMKYRLYYMKVFETPPVWYTPAAHSKFNEKKLQELMEIDLTEQTDESSPSKCELRDT